jgi:hypothetical protein
MAGNSSATAPEERPNPIATIRSLADLIETDHLARIYSALLLADDGEITPQDVLDHVAVPRATVYDDLTWLVEEGLATRSENGRPHRYRATPGELTLSPWMSTSPRERTYFLALVVALAHREDNQNIGTFIDRNGIETLADALEYTLIRLDGRTTMRSMARSLDLPVAEAETIFQEFVSVLGALDRSPVASSTIELPTDVATEIE